MNRSMGVGLLAFGLLMVVAASPAAATDYTVTGTSYSNAGTLEPLEVWDTYELIAGGGKKVSYTVSVTTTGGCAMLLFSKGHDVTAASQYLVLYSKEDCASSYTNSYPVGSGEGDRWTIVIATERTSAVDYTLTVKIENALDPTVIGIIVIVVLAVVFMGIRMALRRRRQRAVPPVTPPMPPMEPPQSPPPQL